MHDEENASRHRSHLQSMFAFAAHELVFTVEIISLTYVLLFTRKAFLRKMRIYLKASVHLFLSKEKRDLRKMKEENDLEFAREDRIGSGCVLEQKIEIYFVRHGESFWNYVFNRGFNAWFPIRVMRGLFREMSAVLKADDSFFVDAGLSDLGLLQVQRLRKFLNEVNDPFLKEEEARALRSRHVDILRADSIKGGKTIKSILCTSNLRRAAHTGAIAFMDRFERTNEKLFVRDDLQEMARNVDAYALANEAFETIPYTGITNVAKDRGTLKNILEKTVKYDCESYAGNKTLRRSGATDCLRFAHWATSSSIPKDCEAIIACGHSIYFKEFFKLFLPKESSHKAKTKKIVNCGIIAFELSKFEHKESGKIFYSIDEKTIESVYGGFVEGKH